MSFDVGMPQLDVAENKKRSHTHTHIQLLRQMQVFQAPGIAKGLTTYQPMPTIQTVTRTVLAPQKVCQGTSAKKAQSSHIEQNKHEKVL